MNIRISKLLLSCFVFSFGLGLGLRAEAVILDKRPDYVQKAVDRKFAELPETWHWDGKITNSELKALGGDSIYSFLNAKPIDLIRTLVRQNPEQEVFRIIDIGAGSGFGWIEEFGKVLDSDPGFEGKKFRVVGLTGGPRRDQDRSLKEDLLRRDISKKVTLWYVSGYPVENFLGAGNSLDEIFKDLKDSVDLVVSQMTMVHLFDQLGTISRYSSVLRPGGFLLTDLFNVNIKGSDSRIAQVRIDELLENSIQSDSELLIKKLNPGLLDFPKIDGYAPESRDTSHKHAVYLQSTAADSRSISEAGYR